MDSAKLGECTRRIAMALANLERELSEAVGSISDPQVRAECMAMACDQSRLLTSRVAAKFDLPQDGARKPSPEDSEQLLPLEFLSPAAGIGVRDYVSDEG